MFAKCGWCVSGLGCCLFEKVVEATECCFRCSSCVVLRVGGHLTPLDEINWRDRELDQQ